MISFTYLTNSRAIQTIFSLHHLWAWSTRNWADISLDACFGREHWRHLTNTRILLSDWILVLTVGQVNKNKRLLVVFAFPTLWMHRNWEVRSTTRRDFMNRFLLWLFTLTFYSDFSEKLFTLRGYKSLPWSLESFRTEKIAKNEPALHGLMYLSLVV